MAVDRETIGVVAMEAMDALNPSEEAELQGVAVVVAISEGDGSQVNYVFKDGNNNPLDVSIGLQMMGLAIQGIGKGGGPSMVA